MPYYVIAFINLTVISFWSRVWLLFANAWLKESIIRTVLFRDCTSDELSKLRRIDLITFRPRRSTIPSSNICAIMMSCTMITSVTHTYTLYGETFFVALGSTYNCPTDTNK